MSSFPHQATAAVASSSETRLRTPGQHVDPALVPVPETQDDDLSDGSTVAKALGIVPAKKTAGSRCADKGKQHADPTRKCKRNSDSECVEETSKGSKCGRPSGASNYLAEDITVLLNFVQQELPLGQHGWNKVHCQFLRWAHSHGCPARAVKSLKTKYKQVSKKIPS